MIDLDLFLDILRIDSTSAKEEELVNMLQERLQCDGCTIRRLPWDEAPCNLLLSWGEPRVVFCTHLDTVPPYIAPTVENVPGDTIIHGRGSCDAKGQIFSMYTACRRLHDECQSGFGLLLVYGEETGSFGAKAMKQMYERNDFPAGDWVIVGEPTENKMVKASKGTKAFEVEITGKSFHSGYPQYGVSAIERFVDFVNTLREVDFPVDPILGETTYNIGKLESDNPQNILSPLVKFRVYFRTTFLTDKMVQEVMESFNNKIELYSATNEDLINSMESVEGDGPTKPNTSNEPSKTEDDGLAPRPKDPEQIQVRVKCLGGDSPSEYFTIEGFPSCTVSFGSDAPYLTMFSRRSICGPGTILVAHRPEEYIRLSDIEKAIENYVKFFYASKQNI